MRGSPSGVKGMASGVRMEDVERTRIEEEEVEEGAGLMEGGVGVGDLVALRRGLRLYRRRVIPIKINKTLI